MTDLKEAIRILTEVYAYNHAYKLALSSKDSSDDLLFILGMLKERRELNVDYLFQHQSRLKQLEQSYGLKLLHNKYEKELLANYIMDLEAKLRNGEIIDFVRAVSPILYRLFMIFLTREVPDIMDYINDSKNDNYDRWKFYKMKNADNEAVRHFASKWRDTRVNSKSLAEFIQLTNVSKSVKEAVLTLRNFEKNVRNPLAHLIKSFDEEELHRTTNFSSQEFLNQIIYLARQAGVYYDSKNFYFDSVNQVILTLLNEESI